MTDCLYLSQINGELWVKLYTNILYRMVFIDMKLTISHGEGKDRHILSLLFLTKNKQFSLIFIQI